MDTLLQLAPVCTLLFLWSVLCAVGIIVIGLVMAGTDWAWAHLNHFSTALDFALIAAAVSGSGMIALGVTGALMKWWSGQ